MCGRRHYEKILRDASGEPDPLRRPFDTTKAVGQKSAAGRAKEVFGFNVEARGRWWKGEPTAKERKGGRKKL